MDGVMIGYPGMDHVITGGRGVLRARVQVHAIAGHSGSSHGEAGAIAKAADLVQALRDMPLPGLAGPGFPLPPRLTVTAISGGQVPTFAEYVPVVLAARISVRKCRAAR